MTEGIIRRRRPSPILLDQFRGAAAAYSLRQLSSQISEVVRVRRSVDNSEQDFTFTEVSDGTLERFVNAGDVAPADYGTGAAAAYSLRHVSDGYTGDVIRVRESTNNTEQDFNPTEIEDGTLLAFCGAGDGHVTTWYDQSGNSNDATQATAASQPKIVSGGSLVTENGKAAIDFDGTGDHLQATIAGLNNFGDYSAFISTTPDLAAAPDTNSVIFYGIGDTNIGGINLSSSSGAISGEYIAIALRTNAERIGSTSYRRAANEQSLISHFGLTSGSYLYAQSQQILLDLGDANQDATPVYNNTNSDIFVINGAEVSGNIISNTSGKYQELILYNSDQSSNRELIETNVNHYYSIYSQTNDGFVTTWYDQSGNGNHATQATAASQPKIVSAGSLVVENGKAALDFDGSDDFIRTSAFTAPIVQPTTWFSVVQQTTTTVPRVVVGGLSATTRQIPYAIVQTSGVSKDYCFASVNLFGQNSSAGQFVYTTLFNGASSKLHKNGNLSASGDAGSYAADGITVGARYANDTFWNGLIQEIILYASDRSSTRQQIESNINTHYGIY